ncbi:MAG: hypothetical protein IPP80_13885 [Ignavibacteria bacterium]|nr:hypothetical protein [Ignavibacteria bacterium]
MPVSITGQLVYSMPVADGANEFRNSILLPSPAERYIVRLTAGSSVGWHDSYVIDARTRFSVVIIHHVH